MNLIIGVSVVVVALYLLAVGVLAVVAIVRPGRSPAANHGAQIQSRAEGKRVSWVWPKQCSRTSKAPLVFGGREAADRIAGLISARWLVALSTAFLPNHFNYPG
jgi:hypothetical protein